MKAETGLRKYLRKGSRRHPERNQMVSKQQHSAETIVPAPVMSDGSEVAPEPASQILVQ
jgi:hypothetical protein